MKNRKGVLQGKLLIFWFFLELVFIIIFVYTYAVGKTNTWVIFGLIFMTGINFFKIYDPEEKDKNSFLWKIKLYLFGPPELRKRKNEN